MAPRKDIEATLNTYGNYGKKEITGSDRNHPFNVIGRTGKWGHAESVATGLNDYTGSRAGVSGVTVLTHDSAVIHLTGGGSIAAEQLEDKGTIHELSINKISAAGSSAAITVFRQNPPRA